MRKIGIIGAGSWGKTLAYLCHKNNLSVYIWSKRAKNTPFELHSARKASLQSRSQGDIFIPSITQDLESIFKECRLIFVAIPSSAFREVIHSCKPFITEKHILISGTKGIEDKTFYTMSEIVKDETNCKNIGVLSGPNISTDILKGDPTASIIASEKKEVVERVTEILNQPLFKLYGSTDVKGVEIAGALKNIIAIAAGVADGLQFGNNSKAYLVTRGMSEISRYGKYFGANPATFFGLAGIGDLIATCYSEDSRNHTFGKQLPSSFLSFPRKRESTSPSEMDPPVKPGDDILSLVGQSLGRVTVEGINTTKAVYAVSQKNQIYMPITQAMHRILFEKADLKETIQNLMTTQTKYED